MLQLQLTNIYTFTTTIIAGNASIEEDQGEVAILFLDICDFDAILIEEQAELIKWIDNLYRQFDRICVEYGVQKIEVISIIYSIYSFPHSCYLSRIYINSHERRLGKSTWLALVSA